MVIYNYISIVIKLLDTKKEKKQKTSIPHWYLTDLQIFDKIYTYILISIKKEIKKCRYVY